MTSDPTLLLREPMGQPAGETTTSEPQTGARAPNATPAAASTRGLTMRASLAAHNRASRSRDTARAPLDWCEREIYAARLVCTILGVDPACVSAVPDPDRYHLFEWADVRLIVPDQVLATGTGSGAGGYEFICETRGRDLDALLLLRACPECERKVPTYRIRSLADLGDVVLAEHAQPFRRLRPDARQYPTDPAHQADCPIYRYSPA